MEKSIPVEPGYSDYTSQISEPPDITNWFSSYVFESFPLPNEIDGFTVREQDKVNLGVSVLDSRSLVSNKDHKPMNKKMSQISNESLLSEPPDIGNWFSSYVYESPILDTSDGFELSVPGESEYVKEMETEEETAKIERDNVCPRLFEQEFVSFSKVKDFSQSQSVLASDGLELCALGESEYVKETEMETEKETTEIERNNVFPRLFEQELVSSAKVTDFSQSQSVLSEPPDVRNWFSSYEYQSPQLSDIHELGFSSPEKDPLIIDESDTEEENSSGIFRKTESKQENIAPCRLKSNDCKDNIVANTAKETSSDSSYPDQGMKKMSSVGMFDPSTKEVKQQSSFKQEPLFCERKEKPSFSPRISHYDPILQSPLNNEASLHELRPKHIQETISMNSIRQNSPSKAAREVCPEENLESTEQESDDKENVHGKSIETGFVTMKKARFREAIDRCSTMKPNRGVLVECSSSKEFKKIDREKYDEEISKKKKRVLGEMSKGTEEIAGKWRCPQKKKGKSVPPLKQLRLDAWIHKV